MATITTSTIVESVANGNTKRNLYRYVLSDGTTHERRSWINESADNNTDLAARGTMLLDELVAGEITQILSEA